MSIDKDQLRDLIRRTLVKVPKLYSEDAVTLLMLTAAAESDLGTYLVQIDGPALGVMQVEPDTMRDCFGSFLYFRDSLKEEVRKACGVWKYDIDALEYNFAFNILMARLKYWRDPAPMPDNLEDMAKFHERVYNAHADNYADTGKMDWEIALGKYHEFVE